MMTYLENDVLPFPSIKGIDLGPAMKRKVLREDLFSHLNTFEFRVSLKKKFFNMLMIFLFH
jgi:hypothetical protein